MTGTHFAYAPLVKANTAGASAETARLIDNRSGIAQLYLKEAVKQKPGAIEDSKNLSAERCSTESLPELGVTPSEVLLVFRKRLTGRPRPAQASLRLGMVAHVAFAALFL